MLILESIFESKNYAVIIESIEKVVFLSFQSICKITMRADMNFNIL